MRYLKCDWNESRGDEYDNWGIVSYYFEIAEDNYPVREIEIYQNGNSLKYDCRNMLEDQYGGLSDQPIIENEMEQIEFDEIDQLRFERLWKKSGFINGESQW